LNNLANQMKQKYPGSQFFVLCCFDPPANITKYRDANPSLIFLNDYPSGSTWYAYKYDDYVPLNYTLRRDLRIHWRGHESDFNTMKQQFEGAATFTGIKTQTWGGIKKLYQH